MSDPKSRVDTVLQQEWVNDARQRGASLQVLSRNGRALYSDTGLADLYGASALKDNGFDMIPAETVAEATGIISRFAANQTPVRVRFPVRGDRSGLGWFRFEVRWPDGLIAMAVWPEDDVDQRRITVEPLDT